MASFKVTAKAVLEYEVEAEDDELAVEQAVQRFDEAYEGDPVVLFDWTVKPIVETERG